MLRTLPEIELSAGCHQSRCSPIFSQGIPTAVIGILLMPLLSPPSQSVFHVCLSMSISTMLTVPYNTSQTRNWPSTSAHTLVHTLCSATLNVSPSTVLCLVVETKAAPTYMLTISPFPCHSSHTTSLGKTLCHQLPLQTCSYPIPPSPCQGPCTHIPTSSCCPRLKTQSQCLSHLVGCPWERDNVSWDSGAVCNGSIEWCCGSGSWRIEV
jgi:hypothetical protein